MTITLIINVAITFSRGQIMIQAERPKKSPAKFMETAGLADVPDTGPGVQTA